MPNLKPLPGYGNHMLIDTFIKAIRGKWFIQPGSGRLATEDGVSDIVVNKDNYGEVIPQHQWATYVLWFFD